MSLSSTSEAVQQLNAIIDDYWEILMKRNPTWATAIGDHRYDHLLPDISEEARARYFSEIRTISDRLEAVPADQLDGQDAVTHEVLRHQLDMDFHSERFVDERFTINPLYNPVTWLAELTEHQPLAPRAAFDQLVQRFQAVPRLIDQTVEHLMVGMKEGTTAPRIGTERVLGQLKRVLKIPPRDSAYMPSPEGPKDITKEEYSRIREELAEVIEREVYPAMARFESFLEESYLPATRKGPGVCHMPGGEDYYQLLIRQFTDSSHTAREIHQIGLDEVARIHQEMGDIAEKTYGDRNIRRMAERLHDRDDQYLPDREAILNHNRALLAKATAALPDYFSILPQVPCEVRAVESFKEADTPSGYYSHAPGDGSRPAYYYVNTYKPEQRPLYNMEALAFHEAVPGHHLQIAIAQKLEELPPIRRHAGQTAYIEGWALYSERLSDEMGLYSSDFARFGMLNFQAWRAARLVVDTGIHALGWSRERAIQELLAHTVHGETEATIEVDRYICMPGQALAYMLGRIFLNELRAKVENRLGDGFDVKEFHKRILENGALPLATLEQLIDRWLESAE